MKSRVLASHRISRPTLQSSRNAFTNQHAKENPFSGKCCGNGSVLNPLQANWPLGDPKSAAYTRARVP